MHYRTLVKAVILDAKISVCIDKNGFPSKPIPVNCNGSYEKALITRKPKDIATFLKNWHTRIKIDEKKLEEHIKDKELELKALRKYDIVTINLDSKLAGQNEPIRDIITNLFNKFSKISQEERHYYTAASKVLHVLVPDLFVMWDDAIRSAYGCRIKKRDKAGEMYFTFLKRVQNEAKEAVITYRKEHNCTIDEAEAIKSIKEKLYEGGFYSFARLIDVYNYQKYTRGEGKLWEKILKDC